MIERLIDLALGHRAVTIIAAALLALGGWLSFRELPVEAFPDVTDTQSQVITIFAGHAPEEVERQVTMPIEKALNGTPQLARMRSVSIFGLSVVTMTFDEGTTDYFARAQVSERLREAELPDGVTATLGPLYTPIGEIYRYILTGPKSPMDLRTIQDFTLERQFRQVPGVADVISFGGFGKQFEVRVDPNKLKAYGLALPEVFEALRQSNGNAGGNYIRHGAEEMVIRGLGTLGSTDDIGNVVVASHQGTAIKISDLASVDIGTVLRRGAVGRNAQNEVVQGIVLLRKGENPAEVLERIHAKVEQLNNDVLPKGVRLVPYYDRTTLVKNTLRTVLHNLLDGAVLVVAIMLVFLFSLRGALVVATVIPLSLLGSFVYLHMRHMSANLLSLGAVDFGIIVDGAVVMVENVFRQRQARPRDSLDQVVRDAVREVAKPTLFSLVIIIVAYIPIFTLQRVEGRIFAPMANTVASALVGALLLSLTLVPVLCTLALRGAKVRHSPLVTWSERGYRPALGWALRHRALIVGGALAALGATFLVLRQVGSEFLPELNEGVLWTTATLPPSISLEEAQRIVPQIRARLLFFPEVKQVISQLGRPEDGTDAKAVNNAEFFVDLRPRAEWRSGKTLDQVIEKMNISLRQIPGVEYNFSMPIKDNVEESISGIKGQVAIKLYGEDLHTLAAKAEELRRVVARVPGVADLAVLQAGELPQLHLKVDRQKIARYGLKVSDVEEAIETAVGGRVATELWEGQTHFPVTVRFAEAFRRDISAVRDVFVATPEGARIPLSELGTFAVAPGRAAINREANQRFVGIKCNVRGRDMGSFVRAAQAAVAAGVALPPGYFLTWGGEFENQQRAMKRLSIVIPLSIVLIFVLLYQAFGSLRSALLILANIPFALVGGVLALWLTHVNLSVSAAVGFIALMGQAVLNGVLLVSDINARRDAGRPIEEAVREGAQARLRAVLMTAFLAALGLLPAAMSHEIGSETQRPLALVVIGGLASATILTLFVLPVLYALVEGRVSRRAVTSTPAPSQQLRAVGRAR
ncbi:MAG: CusA/CzcA family heavy metal efflux RND transporter [Polyangia bacterium]